MCVFVLLCVCLCFCVCVCAFVCMDGVGAQDAHTKGQSYGVTMHVQKSNPIWERANLMVFAQLRSKCVHKRLGV